MSVYAVTGKLGNGKSLVCVQQIETALLKGLKVATNIDINVLAMLRPNNKISRLYRVPDKPTLPDLEAIGLGYDGSSYDEEKFGLLILDELGTWFNARSWNDKTRQPLINWFLHARKKRWHVYFIVQDENLIDKQLRESLFEHVVHCRRLDRMRIPLVTPITSALGCPVRFPKLHIGIVQYMLQQSAMIVDRWYSFGERCYNFYDTQQIFSPDYDRGSYSVLPPGYLRKPPKTHWNVRKIMRYTKIQGKRYMRPMFIISVLVIGLLIGDRYLDSSYCNSMVSEECDVKHFQVPTVAQVQAGEPESLKSALMPSAMFGDIEAESDEFDFSNYLDPFHAFSSRADYVQFSGLRATDLTRKIPFSGYLTLHPSGQRFKLSEVLEMGWHAHPIAGGFFLQREANLVSVYWMDISGTRSAGSGPDSPSVNAL